MAHDWTGPIYWSQRFAPSTLGFALLTIALYVIVAPAATSLADGCQTADSPPLLSPLSTRPPAVPPVRQSEIWEVPIPYRIECDGNRRLTVNHDGHCDLAASLAILRTVAARGRSGEADSMLFDLRGIDYIPTFEDVQLLAEEAGRTAAALPLALVVSGALQTGVARQFATLAGQFGSRVGVFADLDAADRWFETNKPEAPESPFG